MTKKGNRSWKPFDLLDIQDKDPNYRYRWCDKDPANLTKKQAEGWQFAEKAIAKYKKPPATKATAGSADIDYTDQSLTTMTEYRESILMVLPEEIALERDAYFAERTESQRVVTPKERALQMARQSGVPGEHFYEPTTID